MTRLLYGEWVKVRTTRTTLGLVAGLVVLVALLVCVTLAGAKDRQLHGAAGLRTVLTIGGSTAYIFALAVGIIGIAGEYRHGTMTAAVLGEPRRWPLVVAKLVVYALVGLAFALIATAVTFAIAAPWMHARHAGFGLDQRLVQRIALGSLIAGPLFAVIGVGLGALVREQVIALLIGVGWTLIVDTVVSGAAPDVGKFMPGGAVTSLLRSSTHHVLTIPQASLLLVGYAALFAAAGTAMILRRDVD